MDYSRQAGGGRVPMVSLHEYSALVSEAIRTECVADALKNFIIPLRNVYSFFVLYANIDHFDPNMAQLPFDKRPELDRWLLSRFQVLVRDVRADMEAYDIN